MLPPSARTTGQVGGSEDKECACHLAHEYNRAEDEDGNVTVQSEHHYGFKFMMPLGSSGSLSSDSFGVLARSMCNLQIPIVFMWRRNILRRLISSASNGATARAGMSWQLQPWRGCVVVGVEGERGGGGGHFFALLLPLMF